MLVKSLFFLVLSVLAFAKPQTDEATEEALRNLDVNALTNRIEFISNFHHSPMNPNEGDIITINYDPPTAQNAAAASGLVNYFTIAIGTGNGFMVDDQFFMESELLPIPTTPMTYKFQLPAQMENKKYCIVYTPYTDETATSKPMVGDQIMESLYETWFPIKGSLTEGSGPAFAENTITNASSGGDRGVAQGNAGYANQGYADNSANGYANQAYGNDMNGYDAQQVTTDTTTQQLQNTEENGSVNLTPAFTAFIAVLFACFFI